MYWRCCGALVGASGTQKGEMAVGGMAEAAAAARDCRKYRWGTCGDFERFPWIATSHGPLTAAWIGKVGAAPAGSQRLLAWEQRRPGIVIGTAAVNELCRPRALHGGRRRVIPGLGSCKGAGLTGIIN